MIKRWLLKDIPPPELVESLQNAINSNPILSAVLVQRGITDFDLAKAFFRPTLANLHDPFLMKDMNKAVERLKMAIDAAEKILIYGDYDVDGTTSVALVFQYIRQFHSNIDFYIPDRYKEGYGVSKEGIQFAIDNGYSLVITLDCGIKSADLVSLAATNGIDFIICDHHLPDSAIPPAFAVLDPKQSDCRYPFKELSGCGIGYKFMQAYALRYGTDLATLEAMLDLVAVSIASDIVAITGENRILTYFGLKVLNENPCPGLKALKESAGIESDLDVSGIVFTIGPRINAAGRIESARTAVDLLISRSEPEAKELAEKVNVNNGVRKQFDTTITKEALNMVENSSVLRQAKSTVLYNKNWNKGVIGIVASRCIEKYYRPTIILTESNEKITGSARSIYGFDLYEAIEQCADLLEKFGGHKYAAGLTLTHENLDKFIDRFEKVVTARVTDEMLTPVLEIDHELNLSDITPKFLRILKQMAPFGPENQNPVFVARNLVLLSIECLKNRHLKLVVTDKTRSSRFHAIGFDMMPADYPTLEDGNVDLVFTLEENTFRGETTIQLRLRDIRLHMEANHLVK